MMTYYKKYCIVCTTGLFILLNACSNNLNTKKEAVVVFDTIGYTPSVITEAIRNEEEQKSAFTFNYIYSPLGSQMGEAAPRFKIRGTDYLYTYQQNSSWDGSYDETIDTIAQGNIAQTAIDSIKEIVSSIKETEIYATNPNIMSRAIISFSVQFDKKHIGFKLHNGFDARADSIIQIINQNIIKDDFNLLSGLKPI